MPVRTLSLPDRQTLIDGLATIGTALAMGVAIILGVATLVGLPILYLVLCGIALDQHLVHPVAAVVWYFVASLVHIDGVLDRVSTKALAVAFAIFMAIGGLLVAIHLL